MFPTHKTGHQPKVKFFLLIAHSFKNRQYQFKAAIVDETRDNILFELYELVRVFKL